MFCKKCGSKLPDGSVFCDVCGTRQSAAQTTSASAAQTATTGQSQPAQQPQSQPQPQPQAQPQSQPQPQPQPQPKSFKGLIIILIVIGVVLIIALVVVGVLLVKTQSDNSAEEVAQETTVQGQEVSDNATDESTPAPAVSESRKEDENSAPAAKEDKNDSEDEANEESGPYGNPKIDETVILDSVKVLIKATDLRVEDNGDICLDLEVENKMKTDLYLRFYAGFINGNAISCYLNDTIETGKTGKAVMYFRNYSLDMNEIKEVGDIDVSLFGRDDEYNTLFETGLVNIPTNLHGKVDQTFDASGEMLDITWAEGEADDISIKQMDTYYKPGDIMEDTWMFCFAVENNSKDNTYTFGEYNLKVDDGSDELIESDAGYTINTLYPGTRGVIVYLVDQTVMDEEGIGTPIEFFDDLNVYKGLDALDDEQVGYAHFRVKVK